MTTLASVTPGILTDGQMKRINEIYLMADRDESRYGIENYGKTANPNVFSDASGKRVYDWESAYDGARLVLDWFN